MERKIGEVFECDRVKLRVEQESKACEGCYFYQFEQCDGNRSVRGECQSASRSDGGVIFRKVEDMESRTVKLTLEKAKEFYKKGGEFKELALSAFTEDELIQAHLPRTWEEFCSNYPIKKGEYFISSIASIEPASPSNRRVYMDMNVLPSQEAAKAHLALMQLHQLRDCYRQGWTPDWSDSNKDKYCIIYNGAYSGTNSYRIDIYIDVRTFLSFQSEEIAKLFLENFRSLIAEAGDLI